MSICRELLLIAHLYTAHFGAAPTDATYGAGVECRHGQASVAVGAFRNSFERTSVYAAAGLEPLRLGERVGLGVFAGATTGYEDQYRWPVVVGVRARASIERFEIGAIVLPPCDDSPGGVHFTLAWSINQ